MNIAENDLIEFDSKTYCVIGIDKVEKNILVVSWTRPVDRKELKKVVDLGMISERRKRLMSFEQFKSNGKVVLSWDSCSVEDS